MPRKLQDFAENLRFIVCLFPLRWKSDSKNSFATCHSLEIIFSLVMSSPGGPGMLNG